MSATDQLLANADRHAASFRSGELARRPTLPVAVVACLDARMNLYSILWLAEGQANIIRNAGGIVTDDTIRSLAISQRLLGTREIILLHHTDCGMTSIDDDEFADSLEADSGVRPAWAAGGFTDVHESVRLDVERIKASPFIPEKGSVRGFVYDVATGKVTEAGAA